MSEQSQRIRAALSRSGTRHVGEPESQPGEGAEPAAPSIAVSEENLATLLGSQVTSSQPIRPAPAPEVETTLPLIGAGEANRGTLGAPGATLREPRRVEPAASLETLPLIVTGAATGPERTQGRFPVVLVALGGLVVVAAGLSAYLLRDHWLPSARQSTASPAAFPLQLGVESQGNGLINIRWNPQSGPVAQAREGRLVITERDQPPQVVPLASEQLKMGHLYFQSSAERIEFRLEVVDPTGATTNESVLALSSGAATPSPDAPLQAGQSPALKAPGAPNIEAKGDSPPVAKAVETQQPSRAPIRTFTLPPPPVQPSPEEGRVVLPDSPAIGLGGSAMPADSGLPPGVSGIPATRLPTPQVKEAPRRIRVGGNVQAANLIKKVAPEYSPMAKVARIQGTVRFSATIGKDGSIQGLQVLSGNPLLIPSATSAVKQWIYRPTLLNGEPVEVITQIEVNFTLNQ